MNQVMDLPLQNVAGELFFNQPLAEYTSWQVGGAAKNIYLPKDLKDLSYFIQQLPSDEPLLWLGLGSNTLVRDGGFDGTVIVTVNRLKEMTLLEDNIVRVEAGVACPTFARFCARAGLKGAEFWAGIPGTMGGALRMNGGAFNGETWEHVALVETIDRYGNIHQRTPADFTISYRTVIPKHPNEWFVAGHFQLTPGNKEQALENIRDLLAKRAATQPTGELNCGSVFRNPEGDHAGRLIESTGLKGHRIGGAYVSPKHANFIINDGQATAQHIECLIQHVTEAVAAKHNVELIKEVHIIGQAL